MSKRNKENVFRGKVNWRKELTLPSGYLILTIWVAFMTVFLIRTLGASLSISREIFTDAVSKFESGIHLENYVGAWKDNNISIHSADSLLYVTSSYFVVILILALVAYVLSRFILLGNKGTKTELTLAMNIPEVMIIIPIYSLATQCHIRGRILSIILYILLCVSLTTTYLLNFLASLPKSYEEAAIIDGCTPSKTFWRIMFPLIQPAVVTVAVFNFISVWNEFLMALIFATSTETTSISVGLLQVVNAMKYIGDYGGLFAVVIIIFLPTFLSFILLSEEIVSSVIGGEVKG